MTSKGPGANGKALRVYTVTDKVADVKAKLKKRSKDCRRIEKN